MNDKPKTQNRIRFLLPAAILWAVCLLMLAGRQEVQAANRGFKVVNGTGYYYNDNGTLFKGWLKLNGKVYFFDKTTGKQFLGWQRSEKGTYMRFFKKQAGAGGYMLTGLVTDNAGNLRYFNPADGMMIRGWEKRDGKFRYYDLKTGIMYKGLRVIDGNYYYFLVNGTNAVKGACFKNGFYTYRGKRYYFSPTTGKGAKGTLKLGTATYYFNAKCEQQFGLIKVGKYYYYFDTNNGAMFKGGFKAIGGSTYYFNLKDGHAHMGWVVSGGNKYYFDVNSHMVMNTTFTVDGVRYSADSRGVVTEAPTAGGSGGFTYTNMGSYVRVYDNNNKRYYYVAREFLTHPGVANGKATDRDLLAAIAECEAGDQGLVGMEAVLLCILNRTIKADKEFPSQIRLVIYQQHTTTAYPQYTPVRISGGSYMINRLNGNFNNKTLAYQAADGALKIFNNYLKNGTPRKLTGFNRADFNFMYFMTPASFWSAGLNYSRVDYYLYRDHMFFVDWV